MCTSQAELDEGIVMLEWDSAPERSEWNRTNTEHLLIAQHYYINYHQQGHSVNHHKIIKTLHKIIRALHKIFLTLHQASGHFKGSLTYPLLPLCRLDVGEMKIHLRRFAAMDRNKDGFILAEDLADYLGVPCDACLQAVFNSFKLVSY